MHKGTNITFTTREQHYCNKCGAPTYILKVRTNYDEKTGKKEGEFLSEACTKHRFRHRQLTYERNKQ